MRRFLLWILTRILVFGAVVFFFAFGILGILWVLSIFFGGAFYGD